MSQTSPAGQAKRGLHFLKRESYMRGHAASALSSQFRDAAAFDAFYAALSDDQKDEFLRVDSNPLIDYFTNSFKLVSLFSLIESLSPEKHQDFYEWLGHVGEGFYPIAGKGALKQLHDRYKATFGSIRRCVAFF
jgi:hypothetical protein